MAKVFRPFLVVAAVVAYDEPPHAAYSRHPVVVQSVYGEVFLVMFDASWEFEHAQCSWQGYSYISIEKQYRRGLEGRIRF